ncbi:hypothetical protein [Lysinibacter cavernae]|uniref:hypothetical protein n=1 Tax=Lysinibacter cavernae TaxID=1640652 RepID=UPI003615A450
MSEKARIQPARDRLEQKCHEVYPASLRRGEITECVKTQSHWKHTDESGTLSWFGPKLTAEERVEVERIRALGGIDLEQYKLWPDDLNASLRGDSHD